MFSLNYVYWVDSMSVSGDGVCVRRLCVESQILIPLVESRFYVAPNKNSGNIFRCMKLEELMAGDDSKLAGMC